MSVAALTKAAPGFDFVTYFKGINTPVDSVIEVRKIDVAMGGTAGD